MAGQSLESRKSRSLDFVSGLTEFEEDSSLAINAPLAEHSMNS
jgi:hypothetical protein